VKSYAYVYDQVFELVSTREIETVFVYNGRFIHDAASAAAARAAGADVMYFDLGGTETSFDLTAVSTHDWAHLQQRMRTLYAEWPKSHRSSDAQKWFLDRRNHADERNAHFIDGQKIGSIPELPTGKKIVTYFSSSSDEIAELDVDWADYFDSQENALKRLVECCRRQPEIYLVVRSHPHKRHKPRDDVAIWCQLIDEVQPDLHIGPDSDADSYALAQASDFVVTYGSTTGVEAAALGARVAVLGPSAYDELGCAKRPRTVDELSNFLCDTAVPDVSEKALPYGLMMRFRGFGDRYISSDRQGNSRLGNVVLQEPRPVVRKLSELLMKWQRQRLLK
jgi:hypothetical protein